MNQCCCVSEHSTQTERKRVVYAQSRDVGSIQSPILLPCAAETSDRYLVFLARRWPNLFSTFYDEEF